MTGTPAGDHPAGDHPAGDHPAGRQDRESAWSSPPDAVLAVGPPWTGTVHHLLGVGEVEGPVLVARGRGL